VIYFFNAARLLAVRRAFASHASLLSTATQQFYQLRQPDLLLLSANYTGSRHQKKLYILSQQHVSSTV